MHERNAWYSWHNLNPLMPGFSCIIYSFHLVSHVLVVGKLFLHSWRPSSGNFLDHPHLASGNGSLMITTEDYGPLK